MGFVGRFFRQTACGCPPAAGLQPLGPAYARQSRRAETCKLLRCSRPKYNAPGLPTEAYA